MPVSTLRYYERAGLLEPDARSEGNYRLYGPAALERLRFIRSAKDAGFTLEDIASLLELSDSHPDTPCDNVLQLIEHRLDDLDIRIRDLRHLHKTLKRMRVVCQKAEEKEHCTVLDELQSTS